ncbi:hypothetical protein [Nostoc sp. CALU 1950]|uniref:hypothetical protein n=1 Tax=Nostoc sp. CALU 1950 TaxID=3104321 RepID=UPI003EBAD2AF
MPSDMQGNSRNEDEWEKCISTTLEQLRTDYQPRPFAGLLLEEGANRYIKGCAGSYFALERWTLTQAHIEPEHPWRCLTLSNVGTSVRIEYQGGSETLACGESCIIPAALSRVRILPTGQPEGAASLIACYVPDLKRDIVMPLRSLGHSDDDIRALGEVGI